MIDINEIAPGRAWKGGKNGDVRVVVAGGPKDTQVYYGLARNQLPYGGFTDKTSVSAKAFAAWAETEMVKENGRWLPLTESVAYQEKLKVDAAVANLTSWIKDDNTYEPPSMDDVQTVLAALAALRKEPTP